MRKTTLGDLVTFRTGKLNSNAAVATGQYPFFTCSQETYRIDSYSFDTECVLLAGNNAAGVYPLKYYKGKFDAYQRTYVIESLDHKTLSTRFLYYLLRPKLERLQTLSTGAATKFLTLSILKSIEVSLPDVDTQRRIASILSAYDDLIENNTRRIAILEEMARRIYEEWFVRFRFPGHDQVKMVESELGLIPEGWSVAGLFNLATVKYGKNLPKKHLVEDGPYPVYGAAKVIGRYSSYTRETRTIIAGCRGSVGQFQITEPKCFVTNNSFTFDPVQSDDFFWLYFSLCNRGLKDVIGGAAQPQITLEGLESVKLVEPHLLLRQQFRNVIDSTMQLSWNLAQKNANLRTTRDLLLPKLISGELDVSALPEPEEAIAA